jgi:DNA modification methylase
MAESKYLNSVETDHQVQYRDGIPSDYHCTCEYCQNFMGEIFNNDEGKHYSNRIRKAYYADEAGDHLDAGHIIGYRWAVQNLCPEGGNVLDPTVGTGTGIIEAINNGRNGIGIELEYPEVTEKNIKAQKDNQKLGTKYWFRQGNAIYIDEYLKEWGFNENESIDLIVNGTPYPKVSGKSSDAPERKNLKTGEDKSFDYYHEENIGITKGEAYDNLIKRMYTNSIKFLKPGGYFVILIKDMVQNKKPHLLHKHIIDVVLESNPEMSHYGFFLHSHSPTTMFQNTYGKRFPEVPIPWYQVGIVLRKGGSPEEGFPLDKSGKVRQVQYKLHDSNSEYYVDYRETPGKVTWKSRIDGSIVNPPKIEAKAKKKAKIDVKEIMEKQENPKSFPSEIKQSNTNYEPSSDEAYDIGHETGIEQGYRQAVKDTIKFLEEKLKDFDLK